MNVPEAIVKRIYVKGSMSNSPAGLVFRLKNTLASGNLTGAGAMEINDRTVPPSSIILRTPSGEVRASDVSVDSPLRLPAGTELEVSVGGVALAPGRHMVHFPVMLKEVGQATLMIADEIQ